MYLFSKSKIVKSWMEIINEDSMWEMINLFLAFILNVFEL